MALRAFVKIYTFITFSRNTGSYNGGFHIRGETTVKYRSNFTSVSSLRTLTKGLKNKFYIIFRGTMNKIIA